MTQTITRFLGWLGIIPFLVSVFYTYDKQSLFGYYAPYVFVSYSCVILAFLSGAWWGALQRASEQHYVKRLLVLSNVFALIAFAALLLAHRHLPVSVALLGASFWLLWRIERLTSAHGLERSGYRKMRQQLSYVVVGLHVVLLLTIVF
ncbi:MAG: DUF3429 domain-containing protein [Gammaproteobacteria bacterium]|nr:DUF3429 domain-containing protein [Gammaproteobacteria bacterium]